MMLYYSTVFAFLLTLSKVRADDNVEFVCGYQDEIIDCSSRDLGAHLKLNGYANKTKQLIYDRNAIRIIRVMEPSTSLLNLSFRHNQIINIEERAFLGLEKLTYLDLSHNQITSEVLRPITFKGPDKPKSLGILQLKVLDLSSNALHTLHQDLFEFLTELEELNLASNPFKVLDHGTLTALSSIHKIKRLNLASTQLKEIPSNWLNAAKNLDILNLSTNHLEHVPSSLEEARSLRHLILSDNQITVLSSFPNLTTLQILEMNWMPKLSSVKAHSLVNLVKLKELSLSNNKVLFEISEDALIEPGIYGSELEEIEGAIFPPLEKLDLSNNKLQYLEEHFFNRWDKIKVLKLDSNPWVCDCKNQWMVSTLVPIMNDVNNGAPNTLICGAPIEMKDQSMIKLSLNHYKMRCLDMYGNQPDKDAKVLIIVLVVVLVALPVSLLFLHLLKRPRSQNGFPTAYYRRAQSIESIY